MRPREARGLAQHGGPHGLAVGCDFVHDGRSIPPALTDPTTCSGLGLIADLLLNVHKTPSRVTTRKEGMAYYSLVDACLLSGHAKRLFVLISKILS
jgi:hypothetical protein